MKPMIYRVTTAVWWISLGIFLGLGVGLAIMAATTFQTIRAMEVTSAVAPFNDAVNAAPERQVSIVAGGVVGATIRRYAFVQIGLSSAAVLAGVVQLVLGMTGVRRGARELRMVLVLFAWLATLYLGLSLIPAMDGLRTTMYDPAVAESARQAARVAFNEGHVMSERIASVSMFLVLGAMVLSVPMLPAKSERDASADGVKDDQPRPRGKPTSAT